MRAAFTRLFLPIGGDAVAKTLFAIGAILLTLSAPARAATLHGDTMSVTETALQGPGTSESNPDCRQATCVLLTLDTKWLPANALQPGFPEFSAAESGSSSFLPCESTAATRSAIDPVRDCAIGWAKIEGFTTVAVQEFPQRVRNASVLRYTAVFKNWSDDRDRKGRMIVPYWYTEVGTLKNALYIKLRVPNGDAGLGFQVNSDAEPITRTGATWAGYQRREAVALLNDYLRPGINHVSVVTSIVLPQQKIAYSYEIYDAEGTVYFKGGCVTPCAVPPLKGNQTAQRVAYTRVQLPISAGSMRF